MAFQPVPNTASFRIVGSVNGGVDDILNTLYVRNSAGWNAGLLTTTATAIGNAWRDQVCPQLSAGYLFDRVDARDEGAEFGAFAAVEYNTAGGVAGNMLTPALCMYAKLVGASGSAPRDGGLFISPFTEADITVDSWDGTRLAAVKTALDAVFAAGDGAQVGNAMVIVSRFSKSANPVAPHKRVTAITNTVTSRVMKPTSAIQRDRRLGVGS